MILACQCSCAPHNRDFLLVLLNKLGHSAPNLRGEMVQLFTSQLVAYFTRVGFRREVIGSKDKIRSFVGHLPLFDSLNVELLRRACNDTLKCFLGWSYCEGSISLLSSPGDSRTRNKIAARWRGVHMFLAKAEQPGLEYSNICGEDVEYATGVLRLPTSRRSAAGVIAGTTTHYDDEGPIQI